ncbi:iron transport multicopper oxidase FET3 precursor [Scheffersomyces coipomensis]|uniref:iron transport multicopper oxidase FET3 precursor n=1 Tax=Scheffersomyces coipomensis TaxID=1788519 RepID=UPI00315D4A08
MKLSTLSLFLFSCIVSFVAAETHTWWFETGWVNANPDGFLEKPMIGWNGTWPLPILRAKKGDTINLYLINGFTDANTTLHFHGMFQNGSSQMDGPPFVTQCPIPPGETMLYNFTLTQHGTYWYHSHTSGQYGDGMRGIFYIDDTEDYPYDYDEEVFLSVTDNYHHNSDYLNPRFLNRYNPAGAEPIPDSSLFNETRNVTWHVQPDTTYLVHIVNVGRFVSQYLYMEGHEFEIVEVDGVMVEKNATDLIYIAVAQRYSVLITTKSDTSQNYAFMNSMDQTLLDYIPADLIVNSTNWIVYDDSAELPGQYYIDDWDADFDDFFLRPLSNQTLFPDPDYVVTIDVVMDNLGNGINYAFFNNITYTPPTVPTLITALTSGEFATNELVYGTNTNSFVLQKGDIIDIVVNNQDSGKHPFHLHGHIFQLIERHPESFTDLVSFNNSDHAEWPEYPMMRDTAYVYPQSYMVLRFVADNPGVWFFHCHIEWHLDQGLAVQFVEDPMGIQADPNQALTPDYINSCQKNNISISGNAAGNSVNLLDLTGEPVQHKPLPPGFTAKGIVALVFSCIAGICGIAAIAVYGMAEIKDVEHRVARDLALDIEDEDDEDEITQAEEGSSSGGEVSK